MTLHAGADNRSILYNLNSSNLGQRKTLEWYDNFVTPGFVIVVSAGSRGSRSVYVFPA